MPSFGDMSDEEMITCPHCGYREYPEVGFGHICTSPNAMASSRAADEAFDRRFFGSRRVVRTAIVIEHYDTDDCFQMALSSIHSRRPHSDGDALLGYQYVVVGEV